MKVRIDFEARYAAQNYHPLPIVLERGEGVWVWDVEGRRYLDMMSAYSAVSFGHSHPRLVKALCEQAGRLAIVSRAFHSDKLGPFLARLCEISGMEKALPMNTGAEAVETAIKAARRWGYRVKGIPRDRAEIIVASGNFHGRTTTIISMSSNPDYQDGFWPLTPGFRIVPYGDAAALEAAITPDTCAVLIEPIQGEAGIIVPPAGYLRALRRICDATNTLLILDEIQSGLARTGKTFAFEYEDIHPDGLIVGKALGGGLIPVSAFLAKAEIMDVFIPGSHGSTFGGNPLAAAVGLEALNVMVEENLAERSAEQGRYLSEKLAALKSPAIREIRGSGLWLGVEIDPKFVAARRVAEALMGKGLLAKETHDTVLRIAPPLTIERPEIDWAVETIDSVLSSFISAHNGP
jgi:ornithine--oxo-acid transaminase